jgi:VIT1/CCC1 family predicted Fe2+/Mn2+ transporter
MAPPPDENSGNKHSQESKRENEEEKSTDIEVLRHAHAGAQETLGRQIQYFPELDNKALQLVQLNGIVLSIIAGIFIIVDFQLRNFSVIIFTVIPFVLSILLSLLSYQTTPLVIGLSESDLDIVNDYNFSEKEFLQWIISRGYQEWIQRNQSEYRRRSFYIQSSLYAFVLGVLLLTVGIIYITYVVELFYASVYLFGFIFFFLVTIIAWIRYSSGKVLYD